MIVREGNIVKVEGSVTVDNVSAMTAQGTALLDAPRLIVDLAAVAEVDSSIVSMLLEWLRVASQHNGQLQFINQPESLKSLVQLYGVSEFIPSEAIDLVEE
ncbi:MAG: STAS domain-containing protein [Nitrosomonas sp.]|nr:STAS domain-containing protein [Nitrosomonas sp.]